MLLVFRFSKIKGFIILLRCSLSSRCQFLMSLSASDVSESSVPECQCFRSARVLSQVQRSGGECSTFHPVSALWRLSRSNRTTPSSVVYLTSTFSKISSVLTVIDGG